MRISFHTNHQFLLITIALSFLILSVSIAVMPAYFVQENNPPLNNLVNNNEAIQRGKEIYIAEGCQSCHTQQVRSNVIDRQWGDRPSIPADYAGNTRIDIWRSSASVLGSERTGPDLTNVGQRQPGELWHYLHLYNPRSVVKASIMPGYPWLFEEVTRVENEEKLVNIPEKYGPGNRIKIITTQRAKDLVTYLLSLKQAAVPEYLKTEFDAYEWQVVKDSSLNEEKGMSLDGKKLYVDNCQVCHQKSGEGVDGAFPPLAGSQYANKQDPSFMITTVLYGLDRDNKYGAMMPFVDRLTDKEIAAILSFERSSWGNKGGKVSANEVKLIREAGKPSQWPL